MTENKNIPLLRFNGFDDEWKLEKITNKFDFSVSSNTFSRSDLCDEGNVYNVHYGDVLIKYGSIIYVQKKDLPFLKIQNVEIFNNQYLKDGDIVFADTAEDKTAGKVSEIVDVGDFKVVSGLHTIVMRPILAFAKYFLGYYFNSEAYHKQLIPYMQGIKVLSISKGNLLKTFINFPKQNNEQKKIGNTFEKLDIIINSVNSKYDKLVMLKKALLDKMFPAEGESKPKLRFNKFINDCQKTYLSTFGKCQSGFGFPNSEQNGKEGIPFYKVSDMNNLGNEIEMITSNNYVTNKQIKNNNWRPIINLPAIIFAKVGAAIMLNRKRLCRSAFLLDNNMMAYKIEDNMDGYFCKILFDKLDLTKLIQVGALPSYNEKDVENIQVCISVDLKEQIKIGNLFRKLDKLIALYKIKVEKLNNLKSAMLSKMFVE